jgi:hypothetical protein
MTSRVQTRVPRWVPYIWLAYLFFFLWEPVMEHAGWRTWIATSAALCAFLFFYFSFFNSANPGASFTWPASCRSASLRSIQWRSGKLLHLCRVHGSVCA